MMKVLVLTLCNILAQKLRLITIYIYVFLTASPLWMAVLIQGHVSLTASKLCMTVLIQGHVSFNNKPIVNGSVNPRTCFF